MKLIPTPHKITTEGDLCPITGIGEIICQVPVDATVSWGLEQLKNTVGTKGEALLLRLGDDPFFLEKNAAEQGYILRRDQGGLILTAQNSLGFLYGLMTLLQVYKQATERFVI